MQEIIKGIVANPFFSIATALAGGLLGYRLNILKDWRIEFNEAAEVLFQELRDKKFWPDFERFRRRLFWYHHARFDYFVEEYHAATKTDDKTPRDAFGRPTIDNTVRIENALEGVK